MPAVDEHLAQASMDAVSSDWRGSLGPTELASLASCFRYVKSRMNVIRDMRVIADTGQRRDYCVALYEYSHRISSLGEADSAFIRRYDSA